MKAAWDTQFESSVTDEIVADVAFWSVAETLCHDTIRRIVKYHCRVQCVSLDSIGITGFSHDFETLHGKPCIVTDTLEMITSNPSKGWFALLTPLFFKMPFLLKLPSKRKAVLDNYRKVIGNFGQELLERIRSEKKESGGVKHPASGSILGAYGTSK